MKKILIGQLGAYGDCLYATAIARQIKIDYPDCHLTWAIGSKYANILQENPHVDTIWEVDVKTHLDVTNRWFEYVKEAKSRKAFGDFDLIFNTQAYPGHPEFFYSSLRGAMFRVYSPLIDDITPVVRLTYLEVERVLYFSRINCLSDKKNVILMECSPKSGQSFATTEFLLTVAKHIVEVIPDTCVIMSGDSKIEIDHPNIYDASILTFREMAELSHYCTLLIGTGSGITQIFRSDWAKPVPTIQLLKQSTVASLVVDAVQFNLPTVDIIEMIECDEQRVVECVKCIYTESFVDAGCKYQRRVIPDFTIIRFHMMVTSAILQGKYLDIPRAFVVTIRDYGIGFDLLKFAATIPSSVLKLVTRKSAGLK